MQSKNPHVAAWYYNVYMAAKKNSGTLVDVAAIGKLGGKARAAKMTKAERSESARAAVKARWAKARAKAGRNAKSGAGTKKEPAE